MVATASTTGIVFYSRTGHSERLASTLADRLNATMIAISAPRYASGFWGTIRAVYDSLRQKCDLPPQSFASLSAFDQIVVCGPVWTSYPATPIRALLKAEIGMPQTVALFLTSGSQSPADKASAMAARDLGHPFVATASLGNTLEGTDQETKIIDRFLTECGFGPDPRQHVKLSQTESAPGPNS